MELQQARTKYIKTFKFVFDDDYIVLREPTTLELKDLGDDGKTNMDLLINLFPSCLIDHSFTNNGVKASNSSVADFVIEMGSQFFEIVSKWLDSLELKKTKKER